MDIADLDNLIKYIKNKYNETKHKYNHTTYNIPYYIDKNIRDKNGVLDLSATSSFAIFHESINLSDIAPFIKDIPEDRIKNFKLYPIRDLVESILLNDKRELNALKTEFKKVINNESLLTYNEHTKFGYTLLTKNFEIIVNENDTPITISFQKPLKSDLLYMLKLDSKRFFRLGADIMYFGLYVRFSTLLNEVEKKIKFDNKELPYNENVNYEVLSKENIICDIILQLLQPSTIQTYTDKTIKEGFRVDRKVIHSVPLKDIIYVGVIDNVKKKTLIKDYQFFRNKILEYGFINKKITPCFVAFEKYKEALNISFLEVEKAIYYIVSGLEAIYTSSDVDLKYAFKMRISTIAKILGYDDNVSNILKNAYDVRSDYAHGNAEKSEANIKKLFKHFNGNKQDCLMYMIELLRKSIVLVLLLDYGKTKNNQDSTHIGFFHNNIDRIMLGDNTVKASIKNKIKKFKNWF